MKPQVPGPTPAIPAEKPDDWSAARIRLALEAAEIGTYDWDPIGGTLDWSERCRSIFGVPADARVDYGVFLARVHPDDHARLGAAVEAALDPAGTGEYRIECRVLRPDGAVGWIDLRGQASFAEVAGERRGVRLIGTVLDVTERRQADALLRASEARFRQLIEASPIGLVIGDEDGALHYGNPAIQRMLGYAAEDFAAGRVRWDAITPADCLALEAEAIRQIRERGVCTPYEKVYVARDGRRIPVYVGAAALPRPDGTLSEIAAFVADLTAQKAAEAQALTTNELLRALTEAAPDPIFVKDRECRTVFANPATFRVLGKAPEEVLGRTVADYFSDPDEIAAVMASDRRVLETGETEIAEFSATGPDGTKRVFLSTRAPLRDGSGAVTGFIGISTDITERKRLEERQTLVMREMHHRVKNTLATVQAIINSTARTNTTVEAFRGAVEDRVLALARSHSLLTESAWSGASLGDVLRSELEPYDDGGRERIVLNGPHVKLPADVALAVGMAVHELTTNAAKHGALSVETGRVRLDWSVSDGRLRLGWVEMDGPPVAAPSRRGFGSLLLDRVLGRQLQGEVETIFAPDGVRVYIDAPLRGAGSS